MNSQHIAKGIIKAISFFLILALLLYVLFLIRYLIIYLIIAFVLALLGRPMMLFLRNKLHISKTFGALITMLVILVGIIGLVAMFVPMLTEQGKNLALFDFDGIQVELDKVYSKISEYFGTSKETVEEVIKDSAIDDSKTEDTEKDAAPSFLDTVLAIFTQVSVGLFSVLFMAFFILKDRHSIQLFFLSMIPPSHRERAINSMDKTKNILSRYFLGLFLQILILFVIYAITLLFVGTEYALIVAFFCALFNIIPYVGPLIGALLMAVLTVTSHIEMDFMLEILPLLGYVAIGVIVGQLIDNFVSQPFIYSNSIKSHPMEIFIVIIAAGLAFGVGGMMVAVPGYAVTKVILQEFLRDNRFIRVWTKGM